MGYLKIPNLYKEKDILLFKKCYAMEKIHGTSAHIKINKDDEKIIVTFFSGGENNERFTRLFDKEDLGQTLVYGKEIFANIFKEMNIDELIIYGEAYGGKQQGMSHTYGKELKFVVFDVKIDGCWLDVPNAKQIAERFGLDFVWCALVDTDIDILNTLRDSDSMQAIKNGMGPGHKAEGIVIRPVIEVTKNNGNRIIAKHKRDDFRETKTIRPIDQEKLRILEDAEAIADEWVTQIRLDHVLNKISSLLSNQELLLKEIYPNSNESQNSNLLLGIEYTGEVIKQMISDVRIEGEGEIVWSKDVEKSIGKKTAQMFKSRFKI